ncbi:MAG: hypothetical protein KDK62_07700 [Chlamydiia bacterium]|nr:hypothetical protein [Chlamydiia bacterium]
MVFFLPIFLFATDTEGLKTADTIVSDLADFESDPSGLVDCVNVITGEFVDHNVDMTSMGPIPLTWERSLHHKWRNNWEREAKISFSSKSNEVQADYTSAHGRELEFKGKWCKKLNTSQSKVASELFDYGVTNCSNGHAGGKTHLKNITFHQDHGNIFVVEGDGKVCHFKYRTHSGDTYLEKETLPDGNYFTIDGNGHNKTVTAHDRNGKVLGSIISKDLYEDQWVYRYGFTPIVRVNSDDGHEVDYLYSLTGREYNKEVYYNWRLDEVRRSSGPTISYKYWNNTNVILEKHLPDGRLLVIDRYLRGFDNPVSTIPKIKVEQDTDFRKEKVRRIVAPAATDGGFIPIYQIYYHTNRRHENQEKGKATVWNARGQKKIYHHKKMRLSAIETYQENELYAKECFEWEGCNLKRRWIEGAKGFKKVEKRLSYDKNQNVIKEEVIGDIRGLDKKDIAVKTSEYSDDGMNLLKRRYDGQVTTLISHYPGTNLIASEIKFANGGLTKRKFLRYDDAAVKVEEIFDDGITDDRNDLTGVTERLIRRIETNRKGLPETVSEYYLTENGEEKLLRREKNTYTAMGRLTNQDVFDANDQFVYSLQWDYDTHGNIIRLSDPEGYQTFRAYDANDNLIYQKVETQDFHKEWVYDKMNRMVAEKEIHPDRTFSAHITYDGCNNKLDETDWYGNKTIYGNNCQDRRFITHRPRVMTLEEGFTHPTTREEYDLLGRLSKTIDPCGNITEYKNTIFGKPWKVVYPDGSTKRCEYDLYGRIVATVDPYGHRVEISYDSFGRPLKETQDGVIIKSRVYNAFHLLSETDAAGNETKYEYDRAGRKTREIAGSKQVEYEYDAMGRIYRTISNSQIAEVDYDFKNRPQEERLYDKEGSLLSRVGYLYDVAGNKTHTLTYTDDAVRVDEKRYNSRGDVIWHKNTAGEVTSTFYDFEYVNEQGQHVPRQVMTDPTGKRMETIMDACGQAVKIETVSPFGELLQRKEFGYDRCGRRVWTKESVVVKGEVERQVVNRWEWDSMGRLSAVIEGAGEPEEKTTRYTYTLSGKKETILKPNGQILHFAYDEKDRLKRLTAPGIDYEYSYDLLDNPIEVFDHIQGVSTKRIYSPERYLLKEELANGLTLTFERDEEGKVTSMHLPNEGSLAYTYKGPRIESVERRDLHGKVLYRASYDQYDLSGKVKRMTLPNQTELTFIYDNAGRVKEIASPLWKQTDVVYDELGNSTQDTLEEEGVPVEREFEYDGLSQLRKESGHFDHDWEHDSLNNLIKENGHHFSYNALNQPLNRDEEYDRNGNLIREGSKIYTYDALDRLIRVKDQGKETYYTYDDMHRRLTQDKMQFLYFGADEIGAYQNSTLKELRALGKGIAAEIGATVAMELEGEVFAPIHDRSGNITALYDQDHKLALTVRYSAFGTFETFGRVQSPWLYSSKRWDTHSELFYFGRRYYNPRNHRWTTADPIKFDGGANLYAYVGNNPLSQIDPYGLSPMVSNMTSQEIWSNFASAVAATFNAVGWVVEGVGAHFVPIPLVRDVIECAGYVMRGNDISDYQMSYSRNHSCSGTYKGTNQGPKQVGHICVTGVNTSFDDYMEFVKKFSEDNEGVDVEWVYNGTKGILMDLIECGMQKLGIETRPERLLKEKIKQMVDERGGPEADMAICCEAHSQGALITGNMAYYLPKEYTMKMNVRAVGPASVISSRRFGSVVNYASSSDYIPYTDPWGYFSAWIRNDRNLMIYKSSNIFDHFLDHDCYIEAHQQIIRDFSLIRSRYE